MLKYFYALAENQKRAINSDVIKVLGDVLMIYGSTDLIKGSVQRTIFALGKGYPKEVAQVLSSDPELKKRISPLLGPSYWFSFLGWRK